MIASHGRFKWAMKLNCASIESAWDCTQRRALLRLALLLQQRERVTRPFVMVEKNWSFVEGVVGLALVNGAKADGGDDDDVGSGGKWVSLARSLVPSLLCLSIFGQKGTSGGFPEICSSSSPSK